MHKKYIAVLLSIFAVFMTYTVSAENMNELNSKKNSANTEMNSIRQKIQDAKKSKVPYEQKKKEIDAQLDAANSELASLNMQIASLQSDITAKEMEIENLSNEESEANDLFKERMRALYEDNSLSYIDVLLNSTSISDFFYRMDVIRQVSDYDQNVITQIVNKKEIIEDSKKELESKQTEIKQVQAQAEEKKAKVQQLNNENQAVLNSINSDISEYEKQLKAEEQEAARIESRIKALLAQQVQPKTQSNTSSGSVTTQTPSASGFIWPCPASRTVTSPFGKRYHPLTGKYTMHNGIDIGGPNGCNIVAAKSGTVIVSEYSSSYGHYIIVNHGGGYTTTYAHLSSRLVSVGASVSQGQVIGKEGSTGWSTGPHLHFEVSINGVRYNPLNYVN